MGRLLIAAVVVALGAQGCDRKAEPKRPPSATATQPDAAPSGPPRRRAPLPRPPRPRRPPLPRLPVKLVALQVPKHRDAVVAAPQRAGQPPWPVIVILHGNFDRPEWECEWWLGARTRGWLLCPRGMRRQGVPRRLDRWTYAGSSFVARETHAALDVLKTQYPKLLREDDATLIGFSLGAIIGPRVMLTDRLTYRRAVFVEGGAGVSYAQIRQLAKRGLRRVAYLCGQYTGCGPRAQKAVRRWKRKGVDARRWIMPGVGHNYSDNFEPLSEGVLRWLYAPKKPTGGSASGAPRPRSRAAPTSPR